MAKQVNRTACVIECTGVEAFLASTFRPSLLCVLVGRSLDLTNRDQHDPLAFREVPPDVDFKIKSEVKRNWVIFQLCRAGYAPIGTPGPYDVRFKHEAFAPVKADSEVTFDLPSPLPLDKATGERS